MNKRKMALVALATAVAFCLGFGPVVQAFHAPNHGYFKGGSEGGAWLNVWPSTGGQSGCRGNGNALPTWVSSADEFINFTFCKLGGNTQERIGAAFIISTMTGHKDITPSAAQRADFAARVKYAESRQWINFGASIACNPNSPPRNSFYQSTRQDNAWYWGCPVGAGGAVTTSAITFYNGSSTYVLMRYCANPLGSMPELADAPDFNMSGRTTVSDTTVYPGQQITFRHYLRNGGPTNTSPSTINWATRNTVNGQQVDSGNAGTFADGQEKQINSAAETVTVPASAAPGSDICRRIEWNPDTENGGSGAGATVCATVQYNFSLEANVGVTILNADGTNVSADGVAEAGYTIIFRYTVENSADSDSSGATQSQSATCTYRRATHAGYSTTAPTAVFVPPGANCPPPRTFPRNSTTQVAVETVSGASVTQNTTICRSLTVSPATQSGGSHSDQACVQVAAKPYARVYGGDVSAGNGFADAAGVCTDNLDAAIAGWNRRSGGGYAGAGVQFAAVALGVISDFSSALGNTGGAPKPSGLAFANTSTNAGNGRFGGSFGSLSCIPDYYGARPSSNVTPLGGSANITDLASGTYVRDGSLTLDNPAGGIAMQVDSGESITLYVNGDVFITDSIVFTGNWNVGTVPLFRLIVQGNIFIENGVGRLDGVYIAQPDGASGGVIHTCATSMAALPTNGNLYTTCNNKLTVNGAFIADQVRLLRTRGTLSQSNASENSAASAGGEVFNFGPALWLRQPPSNAGTADYDAIISLPPIL